MASFLRSAGLGLVLLAVGCGGTTTDGSEDNDGAGGGDGSSASGGTASTGSGGAGAQSSEGGETGAGGSLPDTCEDGERVPAPDGCNTCTCSDNQWACTLIGCVDPGQVNCGAWLGDTCRDDEYCAYEEGEWCGTADAAAVCLPRPDGCTLEYAPVCGCDGGTYSSACAAAVAGTGVYQSGPCD